MGLRTELIFAFALAAATLGFRYHATINVFDEGLALYGSLRVANGELPYRDFWTLYGPGAFYLTAFAFHVFGTSMAVVRELWIVLEAVIAVEVFVLGRALGGRAAGWVAFALAVTHTAAVNLQWGYAAVPAAAAALGGVIALGLHRTVFVAGLLIGATAVFRHDFGVYFAAAGLAGILLRAIDDRRIVTAALGRFAAGMAVVVGPAYGALALAAGLRPMIDQLLVFPLREYPQYFYLPLTLPAPDALWGGDPLARIRQLKRLSSLVPLAALPLAAAGIGARMLRRDGPGIDRRARVAVVLWVAALGFFNHAWIRFDGPHVWPMMLATIPLIASAPFVRVGTVGRAVVSACVVAVLALNAFLAFETLRGRVLERPIALESAHSPGISIRSTSAYYNALIHAIDARTNPGEAILSANRRHDRVFLNDSLLYFLTDRPAPGRYHELNRGMITTARVQREVIDAMDRRRVRVAVLYDADSNEPNLSSISSGITLLDDYIRTNFERIGTFGPYELWWRR